MLGLEPANLLEILYAIAGVLVAIGAASVVYTNFSQKKSAEIADLVRDFHDQNRSLLDELDALERSLSEERNLPATGERLASLIAKVGRQAEKDLDHSAMVRLTALERRILETKVTSEHVNLRVFEILARRLRQGERARS